MRTLSFTASLLSLTVWFAPLHAQTQTPAKDQPSRVVGSVYGKAVTADEVGLKEFDPRYIPKWEQMGRVLAAFGDPVLERFVAQRKLDATADEMAAYRKFNLNPILFENWSLSLRRICVST